MPRFVHVRQARTFPQRRTDDRKPTSHKTETRPYVAKSNVWSAFSVRLRRHLRPVRGHEARAISDVVIEEELVRNRAKTDRVQLALALVREPLRDDVLREH